VGGELVMVPLQAATAGARPGSGLTKSAATRMLAPSVMSQPRAAVLVVDDDESFGRMVTEVLGERGFDATWEPVPERAIERASKTDFAAALVDLVMPGLDGLALVDRLRSVSPDTQFLILTGHSSLDTAVESVRHGVFDYLRKGEIQLGVLEQRVRQAVDRALLAQENRELILRLKTLSASSAAIASELYLDRLLDQVVATARGLCGGAVARALLFDRLHGGDWVVRAQAGGSGLSGVRLRAGEGLATRAAEADDTLLVERPQDHPDFSKRTDDLGTTLPGLLVAPLRHRGVIGALMVAGARRRSFGAGEREALGMLGRQAAVAIDNALQHERGLNFFTHASDLLVSCLEVMDPNLPGHSTGVAAVADMITRRLGLSDAERRSVHFGALLHDIGKLRIPADVLRQEEALPPSAQTVMRDHPTLGMELLKPISLWEDILAVIHAHHERWDGTGYPRGLAGEEIPLGARVVAVADAFDVMQRPRPYGIVRTPDAVLAELEACAGTQFDPRIVRLFVAEYKERGDPRTPAAPRG